MLDAGSIINETDERGRTPLMLAAGYGRSNVVDVLTQRGARISDKRSAGVTTLMFAADSGHVSEVGTLLRWGAAANERASRTGAGNGPTALMLAARAGHTDVVRTLLNAGADLLAMDQQGQTALAWARAGGHSGTAVLLM
ncbi:ankyrin repeat domain-containing protein [Paraburkholderia sp. SIMBA_055]